MRKMRTRKTTMRKISMKTKTMTWMMTAKTKIVMKMMMTELRTDFDLFNVDMNSSQFLTACPIKLNNNGKESRNQLPLKAASSKEN